MVHKFETPADETLFFGPGDVLATAGADKARVWDVNSEREVRSGSGSQIALSPDGNWLVAARTATGVTVQALAGGQTLATFPKIDGQTKYVISQNGQAMARISTFGGMMYVTGNPEPRLLSLPSIGVGMDVISTVTAIAPARTGFVFGNGDGFVGIASTAAATPKIFATDHSAIKAIAISHDEKLVAVADSSGHISIWELL